MCTYLPPSDVSGTWKPYASQIPAVGCNWQIGEWSRRAVGSQIDRRGWFLSVWVVVNGGWGSGSGFDFTAKANGTAPKDAASKQRWRGRDLERFDNLAVDAVVT